MSMIFYCVSPDCAVVAGDRYQKLEQKGGPPIENNGARKVLLSPNGRIAIGLYGDLPLLPNQEMATPILWFQRHLTANRFSDPAAAVQGIMKDLNGVTPPAWCAGGNVFVGGFVGKSPLLIELRCASESQTVWKLVIREVNRIAPGNQIISGYLGGCSTLKECIDAAGGSEWDGKSDLSSYCRSVIDGVADSFAKAKKTGVSGPAETVLVAP